MSSKIRNCIREITKNSRVEELLPEYVKQYMQINGSYASIRLMMEYYMFYETVSEGINPYIDSASETAGSLHRLIHNFYEEKQTEGILEELLELRQEVTDRMQVLTAYVDRFVVYEYILNRVQYRFEDQELLPDDSIFARDLVNFIFASKDNVTVNDNIHYALAQLPMRMARSRYFDIIKDSVSVYKGSDKSSLDGFLYMFRMSATLYQDENMERYFTEFVPVLQELAELDYENIDRDTYTIYAEKIRVYASKLNDISDLYMQLGQLINSMYCICDSEAYMEKKEEEDAGELVIRGINSLFLQIDSGIWERNGISAEVSEQEKLDWMSEKFATVEGKQESLYESMNMAGAALDEIMEGQKDAIVSLGLSESFVSLKKMFLLNSNSVFAELEEKEQEEKVTEQMAEEAAGMLIAECKSLFQGKSRMLRRAVMANTLEKLPVFFASAQEVADYVTNSLSQCDDMAEKYAAKQLLLDIMQ